MAIRPVDLQGAILQQTQTAGIAKQAEDAPRAAQIAAQNQFVQQLEQREETVRETDTLEGNKVNPEGERQGGGPGRRRREHKPGEPLPEDAVELAEYSDGEHIIDFTA
ncbi:MAG TPA: hypothetical protein VN905_08540 [Candidatus Binatia bacterium]|nr:hypothetical protein [Candidatus Binatia bacterium]